MSRCARAVAVLLLWAAAPAESAESLSDDGLSVVPRPVATRRSAGYFTFDERTEIVANYGTSRRTAYQFGEVLRGRYGLDLSVVGAATPGRRSVVFGLNASHEMPAEGYRIAIDDQTVRVTGDEAGLYYGLQTLAQLLPREPRRWPTLPAVVVTDYPRFAYRGLLIDVARHFFSVSSIEKYIDLAAQYKLNAFVWHLTDDDAWRIEIRRHPRLTSAAGRAAQPPGSHYTQAQIRQVVAYARARHMVVIPVIEMPGHAGAALAAYPALACDPAAHQNVYCPREATFRFLDDVLGEVSRLFPWPYVHIGGDEVSKDAWRRSPEAQAIMRRHHLKDEDELQSYFVRRVSRILASRGRRTIGWDEILEGGLAPGAIVTSWRGERGGIEAVERGHLAIMAPTDHCYFDYGQGDPDREPANIGGFVPLEKVYGYQPIPAEIAGRNAKLVYGIQANVWTEYIATPEYIEYMLFPRLLAFSEVAWSPEAGRSFGEFRRRLPIQLSRLDAQHVNYRIPEPDGLHDVYTISDEQAVVDLRASIAGGHIEYTLDGSDPSDSAPRYESPIPIPLPLGRSTRLNLVVVAPGGRRSVVYGATFLRRAPVESQSHEPAQHGLMYSLFEGEFSTVRSLGRQAPVGSGIARSIDIGQFRHDVNFGVVFEGYVTVPADGFYRFAVASDDGAVLRIDGEAVVDNDGEHASRERIGHIPLRQGFHRMRLDYFQRLGQATLEVRWANETTELQALEGSVLFH